MSQEVNESVEVTIYCPSDEFEELKIEVLIKGQILPNVHAINVGFNVVHDYPLITMKTFLGFTRDQTPLYATVNLLTKDVVVNIKEHQGTVLGFAHLSVMEEPSIVIGQGVSPCSKCQGLMADDYTLSASIDRLSPDIRIQLTI